MSPMAWTPFEPRPIEMCNQDTIWTATIRGPLYLLCPVIASPSQRSTNGSSPDCVWINTISFWTKGSPGHRTAGLPRSRRSLFAVILLLILLDACTMYVYVCVRMYVRMPVSYCVHQKALVWVVLALFLHMQVAFLHLWAHGGLPWSGQDKMAEKILQVRLNERDG